MLGRRRDETPVFQQIEQSESGAAVLAAMLGYFGRWPGLHALRETCGASRDGGGPAVLLAAARREGLRGEIAESDLEALAKLRTPFVAVCGGDRYVVVEGVGGNRFYLNDPLRGRIGLEKEEFEEIYAGRVLTLMPGEGFSGTGIRPRPLRRVAFHALRDRPTLIFVALIGMLAALPAVAIPSANQFFIDRIFVEGRFDWMLPLVAGMIVVGVIHGVLTWLQQHVLLRLATRQSVGMAAAMVGHMLRMPLRFFQQRHAIELPGRLDSAVNLSGLSTGAYGTAILIVPSTLLFGVVMSFYDLPMTLIGMAFVGANLLIVWLVTRRLENRGLSMVMERARLKSDMLRGIQALPAIRAEGGGDLLIQELMSRHALVQNLRQPLARTRILLRALPIFATGMATALVYTAGGLRAIDGSMTVGMLIAFQVLMIAAMAPIGQLSDWMDRVQDARAFANQVDDILQYPVDVRSDSAPAQGEGTTAKLIGAIAFRNVCFGYDPEREFAVEGFNLEAPPGATIAVVGRSGSGKSVVIDLLCGIERPSSGEVEIDGRPLSDIPESTLRNSIAVVDQTVTLFHGTIRDNIAIWDPTLSDERIVEAARVAGIHNMILSRPLGYETVLRQDGANLSAGQRVLLDIARAVAIKPSILVLDGATDSLDPIAEAALLARLRRIGCTIFLATHRIGSLRDADEIIVLDGGRVSRRGTHAAFAETGFGLYRRLVGG